jgi:acyl-CoA reductase-like NAD-dependent aldehyde dehydrogenase
MRKYQMYIDGGWTDPSGGQWIEARNPYTGDVWAMIPKGVPEDVDAAVMAAHRAFTDSKWSRLNASDRGSMLVRLAQVMEDHAEQLAEIEVRDNGKLYAEVVNQTRYLTNWFRYYGGLADKLEGAVPPIDKPHVLNFTKHEPLGVCACITPWNSALLLMAWKVAPALAAGNTVVIKPSEETSASTLEFAALLDEAGIPPGVINVVTGFGHDVGAALVSHPKVRKIAFTGGESGGRSVNTAAAQDFKRVTLELGGKSANIVFDDATIDNAIDGAISGIFAATGQTCIAGSRLLLQRSIHDKFLDLLLDKVSGIQFGDPMDPDTQVGPVTTRTQYDTILRYIEIAKNEGARCVLGGKPAVQPEGINGHFIEPTIFSGVTTDMRIAQEEVFGPVLAVIPFEDEDDAIAIANDVNYGLAAGVWTNDLTRSLKMADKLQAGTVWVNTYRSTSYTTPFGGYKLSGVGRENGIDTIKEYTQTKSVWLSTAPKVANPYIRR